MEINVNGNVTINLEAEKVNTEQSSNPDIEVVKECAFQLDPEATLNELLEVLASNPEVLASAVNEAADKRNWRSSSIPTSIGCTAISIRTSSSRIAT